MPGHLHSFGHTHDRRVQRSQTENGFVCLFSCAPCAPKTPPGPPQTDPCPLLLGPETRGIHVVPSHILIFRSAMSCAHSCVPLRCPHFLLCPPYYFSRPLPLCSFSFFSRCFCPPTLSPLFGPSPLVYSPRCISLYHPPSPFIPPPIRLRVPGTWPFS